MLRLTGQYGDGWIPAWWMSPEEYGEKLRVIKGHAEAASRPTPEALEHPLGNDSKGFIDVIIHDLDTDDLRDLAPTIPFEMV